MSTKDFQYTELLTYFAGKRLAARDHWMYLAREQKSVILDLKSFYVSLARNCNHDTIRYLKDMREYRELDKKISQVATPTLFVHPLQANAIDESDVWMR